MDVLKPVNVLFQHFNAYESKVKPINMTDHMDKQNCEVHDESTDDSDHINNINIKNSSQNCLIKVKLNSLSHEFILCIIDSGSSKSIIARPLFEKYFKNNFTNKCKLKLKGLFSQNTAIEESKLKFFINEKVFYGTFVIVEISDPKFLLGCDVLKKYNACIDFSIECVQFDNKVTTEMIDLGHVIKQREVYLAHDILVKANKKSTIPVCVKKTDKENFLANCLGIFNPTKKFEENVDNKIIVPELVTNILSHDILLLHVQNKSSNDVRMAKNETIGHFSMQPLENIFVCHIENSIPTSGAWDESLYVNRRFDFDDIPDNDINIHPKIPFNNF
jgi:hypothetical protein